MRAELFYQSHMDKAVPLFVITQEEWDARRYDISDDDHNLLKTQQFQGKSGDIGLISDDNGLLAKVYLGVSDGNEMLAMAMAAIRLAPGCYELQQEVASFAMVTWSLAQYRYDDYKKNSVAPRVLCLNKDKLENTLIEARAVFLVRDLINKPSNALGPKELATTVASIAKAQGAEFEEWVGDELLTANFPAIHAVGRAAANGPRLLSLLWGDSTHPRVTLVGKGVCFDSGGLNIKPASNMRLMKKDMGGAANVLGLAQWIMEKKLPIHLHVLIPAVENSIGPDAFKPGDILTMRNGLTVEIDNTDAEGRLILADACALACEKKPELLIDFATLTGAARVAVGTDIAAMFTNDDKLADELTRASRNVADPVWRLPLFAPYNALIDSPVADLVNVSATPFAGAITAALFIQRFVPATVSWVHLDIMAWNVCNKPGKPEGGEALGMRAVAEYLQKKYG
jgi:leucyl aminopeptidase